MQATLPTIVVRANDTGGNDVLEGNVIIDGGPGAALGAATALDPGPHVLTVKRGSDVGELRVTVAEGEKKNRVVVAWRGSSASRGVEAIAASIPPATSDRDAGVGAAPKSEPSPAASDSVPVPAIGPPKSSAKTSSAKPVTRVKPPVKPRADCTIPYTVDPTGKRVYRRECLK